MTREASGGDTKAVQETAYQEDPEVDELVVKFINRSKYYKISFEIGSWYHMKK